MNKGDATLCSYFSSALDDASTWAVIRYVERNPVRVGMVEAAEAYKWSKWLSFDCSEKEKAILAHHVEKGLPCGSDKFIDKLEKVTGYGLRYRPQGRPKKG